MSHSPMIVGRIETFRGFFTQAKFVRSQTSAELERRLGFRAGRLASGWVLLFMTRKPTLMEFEVRGMTYMSGGIIQGHLPKPRDPRTAENRLKDEGYDLNKIKQSLIDNVFKTDGYERLCKVIPVAGEFGDNDYPPGSGIPQWTLKSEVPFKIAANIDAGQTYIGNYT